jgi:AcrR family transcriptional regulator
VTPRPRKVSDEDIHQATMRAMLRRTPAELTLADVAEEAGVTASALVQRYGSKRELLLAAVSRAAESTVALLDAIRARHRSPLHAVLDYGECMAGMAASPAMLAHHLGYLQLDLTDADFQRHARAQSDASRTTIKRWLDEAVDARELPKGTKTAELARAVEITVAGSMIVWGLRQDEPSLKAVRRDLRALLARAGIRRS